MRSFHDWHERLSASRISASPSHRFSADSDKALEAKMDCRALSSRDQP
jgi:hypothetical protein